MTDDRDALERLRAAYACEAAGAPRANCPAPERLWDARHAALTTTERHALLAHVAACPFCAEAWRLASALEGDAAQRAAGPERRVPWRALAAVAAVVIAVAGVALWRGGTARESTAYRAAAGGAITSTLPRDARLPASAFVLRWTGPDGETPTSFDVLVATADLRPLARLTGLTARAARVPAASFAGLAPGTRVVWQVEAVLPDGTRRASPTFHATLDAPR